MTITVPATPSSLGRPLLAQQAWDVIATVRYLAARSDVDAKRLSVCGRGSVGTIAILAGALGDSVSAVVAESSPGSFLHTIADPLPQPLWLYAPNILKVADVPELIALSGARRFLWVNPVGLNKKPLPDTEVDKLLVRTGGDTRASRCIAKSPMAGTVEFLLRQR